MRKPQGDSPTHASRHTAVRQEISIFSKFLNTIRENPTNNAISQNVKHDVKHVSQGDSPTHASRHTAVRQEISIFPFFLNTIRENPTNNDISQNVKHDLSKILAWFILDYFVHNLDLISLARKNFQVQNSDDETILADETYYVWDPGWSHPSFINIPTDISSQIITTVSINRDFVRITPLNIDATPINYNSLFTDREGNNSLNSTFIIKKI